MASHRILSAVIDMTLEERGRFLDSDFNHTISVGSPTLFRTIDPDVMLESSYATRLTDDGISSQTLQYKDVRHSGIKTRYTRLPEIVKSKITV